MTIPPEVFTVLYRHCQGFIQKYVTRNLSNSYSNLICCKQSRVGTCLHSTRLCHYLCI